ncbi:hypothetical protein COTS27_00407 [Spirochaetota bacterium]|nr:hypothetical protein COTS27_00407 [Spirochaetota bacterium]
MVFFTLMRLPFRLQIQHAISYVVLMLTIAGVLSSCAKDTTFSEARKLQSKGDQSSLETAITKYDEIYYNAVTALAGKYDAQVHLAIKFAEAGHFNACIEQLNAAAEIKNTDPNLYYYLGLCYTNLAKASDDDQRRQWSTQADAAFSKGLAYESNSSRHLLYYGQGILYGFIMDKSSEAIAALEKSYAIEPYDLNVLFALGNLYYKTQNHERSRYFYQEIMNKTPKNSPKWKKAQENIARIQASS